MATRFDGTRVLITGGTRGIGRAIARAFASAGARCAIHGRGETEGARSALAGLPGEGHALVLGDLADSGDCERIASDARAALGAVDVLVNNAGVFTSLDLEEISYTDFVSDWQRTLAINLQGAACLSFLIARQMRERGGGCIVNVSSRGAFRGEPAAPAYGASKAGLNAMTGSMAQAFAPWGVQVAAVAPGFVETDMARELLSGAEGDAIRSQSPFRRVAQPAEVAHAVLFLADPASRWSSGTVLDCNGASYLR